MAQPWATTTTQARHLVYQFCCRVAAVLRNCIFRGPKLCFSFYFSFQTPALASAQSILPSILQAPHDSREEISSKK